MNKTCENFLLTNKEIRNLERVTAKFSVISFFHFTALLLGRHRDLHKLEIVFYHFFRIYYQVDSKTFFKTSLWYLFVDGNVLTLNIKAKRNGLFERYRNLSSQIQASNAIFYGLGSINPNKGGGGGRHPPKQVCVRHF